MIYEKRKGKRYAFSAFTLLDVLRKTISYSVKDVIPTI